MTASPAAHLALQLHMELRTGAGTKMFLDLTESRVFRAESEPGTGPVRTLYTILVISHMPFLI